MDKITRRKHNRAMRSPTMLGNWKWKRIGDCLMWLILWITLLNIEKKNVTLRSTLDRDVRQGPNLESFCIALHFPGPYFSTPARRAASSSGVHFCLGAPIALFSCSTLSVAVGPVSPYSLREPTLSPYFSHQFSSHTLLTFALWNPTSIRDEEEKKKTKTLHNPHAKAGWKLSRVRNSWSLS
jgi:hypothetical protein